MNEEHNQKVVELENEIASKNKLIEEKTEEVSALSSQVKISCIKIKYINFAVVYN